MSVLVAGFFDLLHSGHVYFLERAAEYGPLTVVVGSDENALRAKGRLPLCTEQERAYMVQSLKVVERVVVPKELGRLNFVPAIRQYKPKYFVTNADGDAEAKAEACRELGVEYVVLDRVPSEGLPVRSTTAWRAKIPTVPYKVSILGGFVDQPNIGRVSPASVVVISITSDVELDRFSGLATSTRDLTIDLFGPRLPTWMTPQRLAEIIFAVENAPGRANLSGTIDVLGMFSPGVTRLDYANGQYWPAAREQILDDAVLNWLEQHLWLVQTRRRPPNMSSPMITARPTVERIQRMNDSVVRGFEAIRNCDAEELGRAATDSYHALADMIPDFAPADIDQPIRRLQSEHLGAMLTGAGGGGYAVVVSRDRPEGGVPVRIRRADG